jgi:hypothetical protein
MQNYMPTFNMRRFMGKDAASLIDVLGATNLFPSKNEIRRLFQQRHPRLTDKNDQLLIPMHAFQPSSGYSNQEKNFH